MELQENSYVLGVWFADYPVGNIMLTAFKDSEESDEWQAEIRLRLYKDNKTLAVRTINISTAVHGKKARTKKR